MRTVIEAEARISATDATGKALQSVATNLKGIEQAYKAISKVKPQSMGWATSFQREIDKMKLSARELQAVHKSWDNFRASMASKPVRKFSDYFDMEKAWTGRVLGNLRNIRAEYETVNRAQGRFAAGMSRAGRTLATVAGLGTGGYAVRRAARYVRDTSFGFESERARSRLAGLSEDESKQIEDRGLRESIRRPSVSQKDMVSAMREAALSAGVQNALDSSDTISHGLVVLQSLKGKERAVEEAVKFFKALNTIGQNIKPQEVKENWEGFVRSLSVEGKDLSAEDYLTLYRNARAAAGGFSRRFRDTTMPALGLDLGAARTGSGLATMMSNQLGGTKLTKASIAAQQGLGIRDKKGLVQSKLWQTDPDLWAWQVLQPALEKKGVDINDDASVMAGIIKAFPLRSVNDILTKLITQRREYQNREGAYKKVPYDQAPDMLRNIDPNVSMAGLTAQFGNLVTALSSPLIPKAIATMNAVADAFGSWAKTLSENPTLAKVAGWGTAAGLTAAAVGTGIVAKNIIGGLIGSAGAATTTASTLAALDAAAGAGAGATAAAVARNALFAGASGALLASTLPLLLGGSSGRKHGGVDTSQYPHGWDYTFRSGGGFQRTPQDFFPTSPGAMRASPRDWSTMMWGPFGAVPTGKGKSEFGDVKTMATTPVKAELEGKADVNITSKVEVQAGTELLRIIERMQTFSAQASGNINVNGPGSTGKSSPDAGAYRTGAEVP